MMTPYGGVSRTRSVHCDPTDARTLAHAGLFLILGIIGLVLL